VSGPGNRRIRRLTLGLIGLLAAETAVFALDAALPPNLARAERASPVALDRAGGWLRALPVERGRWRPGRLSDGQDFDRSR